MKRPAFTPALSKRIAAILDEELPCDSLPTLTIKPLHARLMREIIKERNKLMVYRDLTETVKARLGEWAQIAQDDEDCIITIHVTALADLLRVLEAPGRR